MPHAKRMSPRQWEPGTLTANELEQVLTDAIADIWGEAWRRDQPTTDRVRIFRRRIESALYFATGLDLEIRHRNERR